MANGKPDTAAAGDATPATRKKRAPSGPKKMKPFHAVFRVTDPAGNPIEGAKLEVAMITKNLEQAVDYTDSNSGYQRKKIDVPASDKSGV